MKKLISLTILGFIFISCAYEASAQSSAALSLKGIKRIQIVIEDFHSETGRFVSREAIAQSIGERLRRRGIQITTDTKSDDRYNYLYANLNLLSDGGGVFFNIKLSFKQIATLDNDERMIVTTWDKATIATGGATGARKQIMEIIEELTDEFLLDYLTVNR